MLLKQAETFRARPAEFAFLLAERGGIGRRDLDAFEDLHARARHHRRAATMRYVHQIKREAKQQGIEPEMRQGMPPLGGRSLRDSGRRADRAHSTDRAGRWQATYPDAGHTPD